MGHVLPRGHRSGRAVAVVRFNTDQRPLIGGEPDCGSAVWAGLRSGPAPQRGLSVGALILPSRSLDSRRPTASATSGTLTGLGKSTPRSSMSA